MSFVVSCERELAMGNFTLKHPQMAASTSGSKRQAPLVPTLAKAEKLLYVYQNMHASAHFTNWSRSGKYEEMAHVVLHDNGSVCSSDFDWPVVDIYVERIPVSQTLWRNNNVAHIVIKKTNVVFPWCDMASPCKLLYMTVWCWCAITSEILSRNIRSQHFCVNVWALLEPRIDICCLQLFTLQVHSWIANFLDFEMSSASFLAEISVSSPQKICIFII